MLRYHGYVYGSLFYFLYLKDLLFTVLVDTKLRPF